MSFPPTVLRGDPIGSRELTVDVPHTFEPLGVGHAVHSEVRLARVPTNKYSQRNRNRRRYLRNCSLVRLTIGAVAPHRRERHRSVEPGARLTFEMNRQRGAALATKRTGSEVLDYGLVDEDLCCIPALFPPLWAAGRFPTDP